MIYPTVQTTTEMNFTISRTLEDGIERTIFRPKERRFQTPLLMQHGMWHGAWCWQQWQELFAQWGWESHAFSLPGHAGSPVQRPIAECTLEYYLSFLQAEVERLSRRPVLVAHSMGGALAQWYLKYISDDFPALVLVAAWVSHDMARQTFRQILRLDPWGFFLRWHEGTATPFIRNPQRAARLFITENAVYSPEELHARLGPESGRVVMQHRPPLWSPPEQVKSPLLWLGAEKDALIAPAAAAHSAAFYQADYILVKGAGHDLMLEQSYRQSAEVVHNWLAEQELE